MIQTWRRGALMALLAVLAVASACSSGSSSEDESADDAAPEPTAVAAVPDAADEASPGIDTDEPNPTPVPGTPFDLDRPPVDPEQGSAETFGALGETEAEFETDEGSVQIGSGDVPAGAADFPVPPDLEIELASETESDLGFSGLTALSFAELVDFYTEGLPAAGFEIISTNQTDDVFAVFAFESESQVGQVAISQAPGFEGWTVLVTLGDGSGDEEQVPGLGDDDADEPSDG